MASSLAISSTVTDRRVLALGGILPISFLFCYADVLAAMVRQWWEISFYSYAFLIPVISAYLVWVRRDQLWAVQPQPSYAVGTAAVAAGLLTLMVGRAAGVQAVQQISLLMTLPGVILFLFGWPVLKVLGVPIAFLGFMIPVWDAITEPLHFPFQRLSADLGVWLLNVFGIPVYQNGVFIYLPNITLEVAKSCSGVNYLIAVLATSISLSTIVLHSVWKRITLVLFAVTVSALANSLRVALIGMLAYYNLSGDLHGPYHTLHGMFTSIIGYGVIFVGLWALSRGQQPISQSLPRSMWQLEWSRVGAAWTALAVVLTAIGASAYVDRSRSITLSFETHSLSLADRGWVVREMPVDDLVPFPDFKRSLVYQTEAGEEVRLKFWYFEKQSQGKELIHAGTPALHNGATLIKLWVDGERIIEVNRKIVSEGGTRRMVVFWYDLNGRVLATPLQVKIYTAIDAIMNGRTNGALIWVECDLSQAEGVEINRATDILEQFVTQVFPRLGRALSNTSSTI